MARTTAREAAFSALDTYFRVGVFIEESLDRNIFLRVHKSDIININYLKSFHNTGEFLAEMIDGSMVKVSRRCRKQLEDKLKQVGNRS